MAYKVVRKLFHKTPYVALYPKLDALMDKYDGAVALTRHLDAENGKVYKKRKAYVDALVA